MSQTIHVPSRLPIMRSQRVVLSTDREIVTRFHSRCRECGLAIGPGETAILRETRGERSTVAHLAGLCGTRWSVQIIYLATSARYDVPAYTPDHAVEQALNLAGRSRVRGIPEAYVVRDETGGVVMSRVHTLSADEIAIRRMK